MDRERIEELYRRREKIAAGGGEKRIERQHAGGKFTARERLGMLFDEGSFREIGRFVDTRGIDFGMADREVPADAVVTGYGLVDGRQVYAFSQDFTTMGGSLGEMHAEKICRAMDLALQNGCPFVGINDSGGARIQEGVDALNGYGEIFRRNTKASGVIPQISVIAGPCAGGASYSPALTDLVLMVEGSARMFITGPQVIKAVTGEEVDGEDLGGAVAHARKSGVAHMVYPDEESLFGELRWLLGLLPGNNRQEPPRVAELPPAADAEDLVDIMPEMPNKGYNVEDIIERLVDEGSFLQIHPEFASNAVVGLARLEGRTIGIVANQPRFLAGCLDIDSSDKIARHVRFCDTFNIPLLTLVDTPGYLPGVGQEHGGIIRHGAKVLYAYAEADVPKVSVVLRKAYGGAYLAMCSRSLGADIALAWPTAEIAVMGPEGACNIVFRREIADAEDPESVRQEKIAEYREKFANPYVAAARGYIDEVIDPVKTRFEIAAALDSLEGKLPDSGTRTERRHGNIPM
ncbi:MAG: carboxyl transferase domain-containing protein [Bacillota bacterium]